MIIDSFLFNGELELLELRLKVLYDYVDRFTIVENEYTFRGDKKSRVCKQYLEDLGFGNDPKINLIESSINSPNPNDIENGCRDLQIKHCRDWDIVMVADIDELPHPQSLKQNKFEILNTSPNVLLLNIAYNLQYQVNYALSMNNINPDTCFTPFIALGSFWIDNPPSKVMPQVKLGGDVNDFPYKLMWLDDIELGWHLSWMGGSKKNLHKLNSHSWDLEPDHIKNKLRGDDIKNEIVNYNPKNSNKDLLGREGHSLIEFDYTELFKIIDKSGNLSHITNYLLNRQ